MAYGRQLSKTYIRPRQIYFLWRSLHAVLCCTQWTVIIHFNGCTPCIGSGEERNYDRLGHKQEATSLISLAEVSSSIPAICARAI